MVTNKIQFSTPYGGFIGEVHDHEGRTMVSLTQGLFTLTITKENAQKLGEWLRELDAPKQDTMRKQKRHETTSP